MSNTQEIGRRGEEVCCRYLQDNGYSIIERNFRCREGEIDIIAKEKEEWVFFEVKTRTNPHYGYPAEAVTKYKREKMLKAIRYYSFCNGLENSFVRIDILEVHIEKEIAYIHHIKQVV